MSISDRSEPQFSYLQKFVTQSQIKSIKTKEWAEKFEYKRIFKQMIRQKILSEKFMYVVPWQSPITIINPFYIGGLKGKEE